MQEESPILFLTSALLDDRKLLYSNLVSSLSAEAKVKIWSTSFQRARHRTLWSQVPAEVDFFPAVVPYKGFPFNYIRRLNEFTWDYRSGSPTRLSIMRRIRRTKEKLSVTALRLPAQALATFGLEQWLERVVENLLLSPSRSPEAAKRFAECRPAVVVATGPNRYEEPAIVATAMAQGIPALAAIHSWDNLTTKSRMVFRYNGYLVWSEQMKRELYRICPESQKVPVYTVGALQFDVFSQVGFAQSRDEFCRGQGLDPTKPYILYALGSPNFLKEHHGVISFIETLHRAKLREIQVLVRPHPMFDNGKEAEELRGLGPGVVVQRTGEPGAAITARTQDIDQITEWVNTFRHASVVVNLSSSVTIDAAICDKPVVNLDFDPEPGQPNQGLVKDVNHVWEHFKPIAESGGLWLANDMGEVVHAVRQYLAHPELHREKRRWMAEYVCGYLDGKCGERMAAAIRGFVSSVNARSQSKRPLEPAVSI